MDKETDFINRIDCNFPYENMEKCVELINEAKAISENSIFTVIEELARIPVSKRKIISEENLKFLLEKTTIDFDHPVLSKIVNTAHLMIEGKEQSAGDALEIISEIENYVGLWGALSTVYFSCDDVDEMVERKFDGIKANWNQELYFKHEKK